MVNMRKQELEAKRPSPEEDDGGAALFGDAVLEPDPPPDEGDMGVIPEVVLASFSRADQRRARDAASRAADRDSTAVFRRIFDTGARADGAPKRRRKPR